MGKNLLVINVDIRETRVALIENGVIAELHIERESAKGTLGNIYLGKVSRVLPGMQAAFIDIGLERAAFLHVEDLIRPDDFEAYLASNRTGGTSSDEDRASGPTPQEAAERAPAEAPTDPDASSPEAPNPSTASTDAAAAPQGERGKGRGRNRGRRGRNRGRREPEVAGADASDGEARAASEPVDDRADDRDDRDDRDDDREPLEARAEPASRDDRDDRDDAEPARGVADDADDADDVDDADDRLDQARDRELDDERSAIPVAQVTEAVAVAVAVTTVEDDDDEPLIAPRSERGDVARFDHADDEHEHAAADRDYDDHDRPLDDRDERPLDDRELDERELDDRDHGYDDRDRPLDDRDERELDDRDRDFDDRDRPLDDRDRPLDERPRDDRDYADEPRYEARPHDDERPLVDDREPAVPRADDEGVGPTPTAATPRARQGRVRRSRSTRERGIVLTSDATATPVARDDRGARAPVAARQGSRDGRDDRGRGRRDGRDGRDGRDDRGRGDRGKPGQDRGASRGGKPGGQGSSGRPSLESRMRISKTTPIREVVREGQEVLVQVSKEPIGTKGARVTSHVSLPGRYVVYVPTVDHVGISKRIGSDKERARLRETIESMKPPQGGLIVRTVAEGLTKKGLKQDVGYLVRLWGEIARKKEETTRAPACVYTELDLVLKTARDLFTDDIETIIVDSREQYVRLRRFVETFMPERAGQIELYEGSEPIFDEYGLEEEIQRALSRKVPLASGGHLIIDQAEALTAIDVNTGRFVGKGSKDLEETILKTNLEAVEEIAYQLRFRNIGGLIILDLIDMERASNREKVRRRLEDLLARDKAKTTLNRISELGLIEMTRKRTRESLGRTVLEPCFYCDGAGQLQSKQTIAYEILRQIRRDRTNLPGYVVIVNAHPAVVDYLKNEEREALQEAERLFTRRIDLVARKEYHIEQFDLAGR